MRQLLSQMQIDVAVATVASLLLLLLLLLSAAGPRAAHKSVGRAGLQLKLAGLCLRYARLLSDRKFGNALERFYGLHVQFLGQFLVLASLRSWRNFAVTVSSQECVCV